MSQVAEALIGFVSFEVELEEVGHPRGLGRVRVHGDLARRLRCERVPRRERQRQARHGTLRYSDGELVHVT